MPNLKFLASTVPEILGGGQNSKSGSRDPHMTHFDAILHFFSVRTHRPPSPCQICVYRALLWYRQTDRQTDTNEIIYHTASQMVRNSNQHSAYAANSSTVHSGSLQLTVYRHGMKRNLAISSLLCVTINCLTIGDHVKKMLLTWWWWTGFWWWWTGFCTITNSHEKFSKTSGNSSSPTAVRYRCCRTSSGKAAKHKTFH